MGERGLRGVELRIKDWKLGIWGSISYLSRKRRIEIYSTGEKKTLEILSWGDVRVRVKTEIGFEALCHSFLHTLLVDIVLALKQLAISMPYPENGQAGYLNPSTIPKNKKLAWEIKTASNNPTFLSSLKNRWEEQLSCLRGKIFTTFFHLFFA